MVNKFFVHRAKETNGTIDKGTEVHETLNSAKQSMYAYLGAYGFGHDANTTFVQAFITDKTTINALCGDTWNAAETFLAEQA